MPVQEERHLGAHLQKAPRDHLFAASIDTAVELHPIPVQEEAAEVKIQRRCCVKVQLRQGAAGDQQDL